MIEIPVSYGELLDKITILEIKLDNIQCSNKKINVQKELTILQNKIIDMDMSEIIDLIKQLKEKNNILWNLESQVRKKEKDNVFDQEFIDLARKIYKTNEQRAKLKKQISIVKKSDIFEEKEY
jgi:hypothetical protein